MCWKRAESALPMDLKSSKSTDNFLLEINFKNITWKPEKLTIVKSCTSMYKKRIAVIWKSSFKKNTSLYYDFWIMSSPHPLVSCPSSPLHSGSKFWKIPPVQSWRFQTLPVSGICPTSQVPMLIDHCVTQWRSWGRQADLRELLMH